MCNVHNGETRQFIIKYALTHEQQTVDLHEIRKVHDTECHPQRTQTHTHKREAVNAWLKQNENNKRNTEKKIHSEMEHKTHECILI